MNDITSRFLELIENLISSGRIKDKTDFARTIGVSVSSLTEISKRRTNVGLSLIQKTVSSFPDVRLNWLIEGSGPMLDKGFETTEAIETLPVEELSGYRASDVRGIYRVTDHDDPKRTILNRPENTSIPIVNISAMAGTGALNPDHVTEQDMIQLPARLVKKGMHHCIRIKGVSMSPTLQDGGYLVSRLLDRSEWADIKDQYIYVITNRDGETFIKRVRNRLRQHGFLVCTSDNPDKVSFPNFNIEEQEIHNIWEVEWYLSAKMPNIHDTYYNRLKEMEDDIDELKIFMSQYVKHNNS